LIPKKKTENWVIELNEKKEEDDDLELAITPTNGARNLLGRKSKKEKKPIRKTPSVTAAVDVRISDVELKEVSRKSSPDVKPVDETKKHQKTGDTKEDKADEEHEPKRKISDTKQSAEEILRESAGEGDDSSSLRPELKKMMQNYYDTRNANTRFKWARLKRWWSNGRVQRVCFIFDDN
jgi:hypothetical protein